MRFSYWVKKLSPYIQVVAALLTIYAILRSA
jgi:hypothetical protein